MTGRSQHAGENRSRYACVSKGVNSLIYAAIAKETIRLDAEVSFFMINTARAVI